MTWTCGMGFRMRSLRELPKAGAMTAQVSLRLGSVLFLLPGMIFGSTTLSGQCEVAHLTNAAAAPYDRMGASVAIDGPRVLAGAYDAEGIGPDTGAAYIFTEGAGGWASSATLAASDGLPYDLFGLATDLQGDIAVVGAPAADDLGAYSGAAYVFRFDGVTWVEEAKLLASDGGADHSFGSAVAVDGDTIVVGAFYAPVLGVLSGAAYVFRFDGISWVEESKLTANDPQIFDQFGSTASISGDDVLIGSPGRTDLAQSAGAAYLFHYDGVDWTQEIKLTASDAGDGDFFGFSVDLDGDVAVVGAIENCICSVPPGPLGTGAAYIFRDDGVTWNEEMKLTPSGGQLEQWFGNSVSISGDTAIVGAWYANGVTFGTGAAYLYQFDGAAWAETAVLLASDAVGSDGFGQSVSVRGGVAAVGAPFHADVGPGTGAAYVFTVGPGGCGVDFVRGDCNGDGSNDVADAITHLAALFPFGGGPPIIECRDACDGNDDGVLNIADPVAQLAALFGAPAIPLPPPAVCGPDPTADGLSCRQFGVCP